MREGSRVRLKTEPGLLGDVETVDGETAEVAWDHLDIESRPHPRAGTRSTHRTEDLEDVTRPLLEYDAEWLDLLAVGNA